MHLELVVPALLHAQAAAPALQLLLARARRRDHAPASLEDWMARVFALGEGALPAGALTAHAFDAPPGHWLRADPVHLRADRDRLLLIPSAAFELSQEEAHALCASLNAHFSAQFTLHDFAPAQWGLSASEAMPVRSRAPLEIAGRDVDAELPDKRFHALLNEAQMALYQHPVNTAREARGDAVVNSFWLWGSGALPAAADVASACPWHSVSADDPALLGLAKLAGARRRAPGAGAAEWLERAPEDGRHLVLLDHLRGTHALGDAEALAQRLGALEERWFAPLLAALRTQRIGMLTVHVPDAGASFEAARADLRRFWRRPRPLSAHVAHVTHGA